MYNTNNKDTSNFGGGHRSYGKSMVNFKYVLALAGIESRTYELSPGRMR